MMPMQNTGFNLFVWVKVRDLVLRRCRQFVLSLRSTRRFLLRGGINFLPNRKQIFEPLVEDVTFTNTALVVALSDGREISMPLEWSSRLLKASQKQRKNWRLIGGGVGIHWELIDEDILVESLLRG